MATETPDKGGADEAPATPSPRKIDPTPQEAYFFLYILKHLKNKPEVDWEAVAREANFKNGPTANARFRQIKQKLGFAAAPTPKKARASGEASGSKTPRSRVRLHSPVPQQASMTSCSVERSLKYEVDLYRTSNDKLASWKHSFPAKAKMLADDADDAEEAQDTEHEAQPAKSAAAGHHHFQSAMGHIKDEEDDEDERPPFSASMFNGVDDSGLASQYAH
ncbi:hypothetical protein MAPG_00707 [Magnaporthiopsis poae ATCC 64411]|uniref:Myb-like DNA-binding domain-containing protein n=1 Tax=Magnaporthiopsis poae (strain ATCC 64411 / 73-15) TaxID=644358 RepID=A0A0C4DLR2_MAGP6|nr:hypothetical protein MAPG_00707 [Magnaporthiopsis poae ATCC 64411]